MKPFLNRAATLILSLLWTFTFKFKIFHKVTPVDNWRLIKLHRQKFSSAATEAFPSSSADFNIRRMFLLNSDFCEASSVKMGHCLSGST